MWPLKVLTSQEWRAAWWLSEVREERGEGRQERLVSRSKGLVRVQK